MKCYDDIFISARGYIKKSCKIINNILNPNRANFKIQLKKNYTEVPIVDIPNEFNNRF